MRTVLIYTIAATGKCFKMLTIVAESEVAGALTPLTERRSRLVLLL